MAIDARGDVLKTVVPDMPLENAVTVIDPVAWEVSARPFEPFRLLMVAMPVSEIPM